MTKTVKISLLAILLVSSAVAQQANENRERLPSVRKAIDSFGKVEVKEVSTVDKFKHMFSDGKVSAQVRSIYVGYNQEEIGSVDTYSTAVGGYLKYELASLNGFNGAVAFSASKDMGFASGDKNDGKNSDELSSSKGNYTAVSEAYINYRYDTLNIRAGRQMIDTPLADSDDIRMIPNTFEAYMASYEFNDLSFLVGNVQKWQGFDAGLDDGWSQIGDEGAWRGGISYTKELEFSLWYYDISALTRAIYSDIGYEYEMSEDISIHLALQYLNETEIKNSATEAKIYGALVEVVAYGVGLNLGYNRSDKIAQKHSFAGVGGGTMYTSMDTMIIDEIADDRDAEAMVFGLVYELKDFSFLYAYGDFVGDKNSFGEKAHVVEQDMGFEYNVNDEFVVAAIFVLQEDKESDTKTANDWNRAQVMVKYSF